MNVPCATFHLSAAQLAKRNSCRWQFQQFSHLSFTFCTTGGPFSTEKFPKYHYAGVILTRPFCGVFYFQTFQLSLRFSTLASIPLTCQGKHQAMAIDPTHKMSIHIQFLSRPQAAAYDFWDFTNVIRVIFKCASMQKTKNVDSTGDVTWRAKPVPPVWK